MRIRDDNLKFGYCSPIRIVVNHQHHHDPSPGKLLPDPRQHRVSFRMTDTFHKMEKTAFIGAAHGMFLDEPLRSYRDSVAAGGGA